MADQQDIGIFIVVNDNEMLIASKILRLKYLLKKKELKNVSITVIDNGSLDRTSDVSRKAGVVVLRYSQPKPLSGIIEHLLSRKENKKINAATLVDGNSASDMESIVEMIESFINTGARSGMGYVSESDGGRIIDINAIIFHMNVFRKIPNTKFRLGDENELLDFGRSLGLDIDHKRTIQSRKNSKKPMIRIPLKSWWDLLRQYKKTYPLKYYGSISALFLILASIPGIHLFGFFIKNSNINYPSFFLTILFFSISVVSLSIGLIMNALDVLSKKIKEMV